MPSHNKQYEGLFQPWEVSIAVTAVSRQKRKSHCLEKEDFDDLLHECLSCWQLAKYKYDPESNVPPQAFMLKVVRNCMLKIVRDLLRDKRRVLSSADSLDRPLTDRSQTTLLEAWEAKNPTDSIHIEVELKLDIEAVLPRLTARQRELCRLLRDEGLNLKEASAAMQIPRATLYGDMERIRAVFAKAKLGEYLGEK